MPDGCQLISYTRTGHEPLGWYLRRRAKGARLRLGEWGRKLIDFFRRSSPGKPEAPAYQLANPVVELSTGDRVRVRPLPEIQNTLDANGYCRGCGFLAPMAKDCGQEMRVARRVDQFFDEARWRMLKCRGIVLLDGALCDGSGHPDTHACDRLCFYFWRTDWLERAE
jgi:hypothetical protein